MRDVSIVQRDKCSFVLCTRNVEASISILLQAIYNQDYDGEIEVIIMDSSDDRTPDVVKDFPVSLVRVEPQDYNNAKTRNKGADMTTGNLLIFLSVDIEIRDRSWLSKLTRHFATSDVAGVFGRQIPKEDAQPMEKFFYSYVYPEDTVVLELQEGKLNYKRHVYFSNVNAAIRRSVWENIKLPEMLISEDLEWARKTLVAGYKIIYDSEAAVYHSHRRSLKNALQWYFDNGATMPVTHDNTIVDISMGNFTWEGIKFISAEYRYMLRNGYWYWIPYAIIYDLTKFIGVFLGSKQDHLPLWLKKALTQKKYHWDKYATVIK